MKPIYLLLALFLCTLSNAFSQPYQFSEPLDIPEIAISYIMTLKATITVQSMRLILL